MSSNYESNFKRIMEDYYICLGAFNNCTTLYKLNMKSDNLIEDKNEAKEIKKGMEADLLSNLGKVGEKAFKYIIGLENLKLYPNQDEYSFELLWKKTNVLKDFAKKHGINEDDKRFIALINYYDENNQKAHNFDYWYSVIDLIMPEISHKFYKFMEYTIQTKTLLEYCEDNDEFRNTYILNYDDIDEVSLPLRAAIFPNLVELQFNNFPSAPGFQVEWMIKSRLEAMKRNGDIFTKLRYASNNPTHQKFNLDEVYNLMKSIVDFIKMIHQANNDLNFDLLKYYAKNKSIELSKILKVSEEEINNLFSLDLTGQELALTIYETNYSYSNLKKLLDIGVPKADLRKVIREGLQSRAIAYFYSLGITDYGKMSELIEYYNKHGEYPSDSSLKRR